MSDLREVLIARRRELGLSQADVATRMGVHQTLVSDLERGRYSFRLATVESWAGALGMRLVLDLDEPS